jgi:dihydroorotase
MQPFNHVQCAGVFTIFFLFPMFSHYLGKDNKLVNLDEDFIKDLAGDSEEAEKEKKEEDAVKARKAKAKLEQRLAIEQKKAKQNNGGKKKKKGGEVDEDDALETFVNKKTK